MFTCIKIILIKFYKAYKLYSYTSKFNSYLLLLSLIYYEILHFLVSNTYMFTICAKYILYSRDYAIISKNNDYFCALHIIFYAHRF